MALFMLFASGTWAQIFTENFDGAWTTPAPSGWTSTQVTTSQQWHQNSYTTNWNYPSFGSPSASGANSTTYYARFHSYGISSGSSDLISPVINLSAAVTPTITFYHINPTGTDALNVYFSKDGGSTWSASQGNYVVSASWSLKTITIPNTYLVSNFKVKFTATSDYGDDDIGLDQVSIQSPCSGTPNAGSITSPVSTCAGLPANLTATGVSAATGISYQWQESPNGVNSWANVSGGSGATTTTYTTTAVNTTRYFRMVSTCSNGGATNNTNVVTVNLIFATYATYAPAGVSEGFESWSSRCSTTDIPSTNWANTPETGYNSWRRDDQGSSASWSTTSGAYSPLFSQGAHSARFHTYDAATGTKGNLDYYVNMTAGTGNDQLSFDYINTSGSDSLTILVSTNGGSTWSMLGTRLTTAATWTSVTRTLASTSATTIIRLRATSDYGTTDIGVDNFKILSPCTGAPTAGTITGNTPSICPGNGKTLTLSGASSGLGYIYQWKSSTTPGGPYTNMGTALTQATGNLSQTTYYVVAVTCTPSAQTSTTPEVSVVVNPLPTPTITPGGTANFCVSGTLTSSAASSYLWSPGGATTQAITASANGSYTVTVTDGNGCTGTSAPTVVTISTQPGLVSITPPTPSAFCQGGNVNLTASGGSYLASNTLNFGTQANQNTAVVSSTDYPAPFTMYWGGQRMQMLIRASELTAAGFSAGTVFNGINFPVVSFGSDWPGTVSTCKSFMVKFGYTAATTITAFQTLATAVRPAADYTPTVGYNNLLSFSTLPGAWNGTDNVIIETTFSNNLTGNSAKTVTQYNSPTAFSSCIQYRADGVSAATAAAGTTVSYTYNARPDFKLNGVKPGQAPFTWSPGTGLNTTSGPNVTANPNAPGQLYTVTATNGACSSTATVNVVVNPLPTATLSANGPFCTSGTPHLTGTLTGTAPWSITYTTNGGSPVTVSGIAASPFAINPAGPIGSTTTYAITAVSDANCAAASFPASVQVIVNPLPTVTCPGNSSACISQAAYALSGASPAGGSYSGAGVSGGNFDPATAGVGPHTITYSFTDGNSCTNSCSFTITVNPLPTVTCPGNITGITTSDAAFALSGGSPAGGTYSGTGVSGGSFNPAVAGMGVHSITYSYTDGNGCGNSCTYTIAVTPPCNGNQVVVKINTDNNAGQLSWVITNSANVTVASGSLNNGQNNSTVSNTVCLSYSPGSDCYGFKLMDSFGDGITNGGWELRTTGGKLILADAFANGSVSPANPPATVSYGNTHSFCLPLGPVDILANECGIFNNALGNKVYCNKPAGATQYEFEFSDPDAGFLRRVTVNRNYVIFTELGNTITPGLKYFARVRTNVAGPLASAHWGSGCEMGLGVAQVVTCSELIMAPAYGHSCNESRAFNSNNSFIYAKPVNGANEYKFRIFNLNEGYDQTFTRSTYILQLKWTNMVAPALVNGSTYNVEINTKVNGLYTGFCPSSCTISIDNSIPNMEQIAFGEATLWPNPVSDGQVNLSIGGLQDADQHISVDVQDLYGKQVFAQEFGNSGERFNTILQLPGDIASGVYLVNITVNGQRTVQRLSIVK